MTTDRKNGYVARVRDNTRTYIEELLRENVRLRTAVDAASCERDDLRRKVDELRVEMGHVEQQQSRLLDMLGAAEAASRHFEDRFVEVEQQNSNLAMLYAASYQLHATIRRAEVLLAIQEIVINLVGSEELAIVAVTDDGLAPLASVGVEPQQIARLGADGGLVERALELAQPQLGEGNRPDAHGVTASIPLVIAGRILAVVAIFRLLPQKPSLDAFDRELFELIATHAATALYCADLHEGRGSPIA
jgi:nitrate/nitrite-specific signal transduction histidine kinase